MQSLWAITPLPGLGVFALVTVLIAVATYIAVSNLRRMTRAARTATQAALTRLKLPQWVFPLVHWDVRGLARLVAILMKTFVSESLRTTTISWRTTVHLVWHRQDYRSELARAV